MSKRLKYQFYQCSPSVSTNSLDIWSWIYSFCLSVHVVHSVSECSLFPGGGIVYRCVHISTGVVFLLFCHFIQCISISPSHFLVSQRAVKDFEVKGVLSSFIHFYHVSFFCSEWLSFNTEDYMNLSWKEDKSLFEKTLEESNTYLDPKVNWDDCR